MTGRLIDHLLFHGNAPSPGGNGGPPSPPAGFQYLVNSDGAYIVNSDGAYILAAS